MLGTLFRCGIRVRQSSALQRKALLELTGKQTNSASNFASNNDPVHKNPPHSRITNTFRGNEHYAEDILESLEPVANYSTKEWEAFKERILTLRNVTEVNFPGYVMNFLSKKKLFPLGKSFLDYLQSEKELHFATLGFFMRLCGHCYDQAGEELTLSIYETLQTQHGDIFDPKTAECVIIGLTKTSQWKTALNYLPLVRIIGSPSSDAYSAAASAAFRNNEDALGWNLIHEMIKQDVFPSDDVYMAWVDRCFTRRKQEAAGDTLDKTESESMMQRLLGFWSSNKLYPSIEAADHVKFWYESKVKENWESQKVTVQLKGYCPSCNQRLRPVRMRPEDFAYLRESFLHGVMKGEDVFRNTTAEELEKFKEFLLRFSPFNVVIDGLNVAFSAARKNPTKLEKAWTLAAIVHYYSVVRKRKILLLGRKHMFGWNQQSIPPRWLQQSNKQPMNPMDYIQKHCTTFFTENLSKDDPFLLYAALYSGWGTLVVSRDFMRDHAFRLREADEKLWKLFQDWQQIHRVEIQHINNNHRIQFKKRILYEVCVQGAGNSWHIPYNDGSLHSPYDIPFSWLCLQRKK